MLENKQTKQQNDEKLTKGAFLSKTQRKGKGQTNMTMDYREENKQNIINRTQPLSLLLVLHIVINIYH